MLSTLFNKSLPVTLDVPTSIPINSVAGSVNIVGAPGALLSLANSKIVALATLTVRDGSTDTDTIIFGPISLDTQFFWTFARPIPYTVGLRFQISSGTPTINGERI